LLQKSCFQILL